MVEDQEIRKLLDNTNFSWVNSEIFIGSTGDELRNTNTFTILFSLLIEILAEVKKINKGGEEKCS